MIPENLPQDITVRNLSDPITDLALARFADYSTQKLTCDDGGSVNLYNGGKLNLYDCTQACKQTPGCFVFKYEEREIDGVLYPTVCKWQKTLKWNECVHTRRLSEYSQRQDIQNAIFSGLYQVAEDGNYNPAGCLLPGQYRTQSGECKCEYLRHLCVCVCVCALLTQTSHETHVRCTGIVPLRDWPILIHV